MESKGSKKRRAWLFILLLLVVCAAIFVWKAVGDQSEPEWDDDQSQSDVDVITYEGRQYTYNTNLTNILFLGIDNNSEITDDTIPGEAGQSDCIMILTLNQETKEGTILQIPRDTMTEIDLYDASGEAYQTITAQLATQYAYATGGTNSCWAAKKTISELLYDLPIDGYLAMDMASVSIVNDGVGGVVLTFSEDYTSIDSAFKEGATITLTGKQAYDFVHYRDTAQDFSNNDRMKRQTQYIPALIDAIRAKGEAAGNYYSVLYPLVKNYMVTDLEEDEINQLMEYELDTENIQILPGEGKIGEKYEEFYVDEEKLQKILIETFYILKE